MPAILRRNPILEEALRHYHPLHSCLISKDWRNEKMATIFVVRKAPTGLVMAAFLIDLTGFGLKDVWGDYGLTQGDIDTIKSKFDEDDSTLELCDLSVASSIIYGGVEWAKRHAIRLPRDYKVWMRILAPINADDIDLDLFGVDGNPIFMLGENDGFCFEDISIDPKLLKGPLKIGIDGPSEKQLERIGDIKGALIGFALNPGFNEDFNIAKSQYYKELIDIEDIEEWKKILFMDWYTLEWQSELGDTFPAMFVDAYGDLMSKDVREMILGWSGVIESIFEIKTKRSGAYYMKNLINEREYVVYPTASMADTSLFEIGDFLNARITPVGDFHVFSGVAVKMPCDGSDQERRAIYQLAIETQTRYLGKAFEDNEEKLKKSADMLQKDYDEFVSYFGSDELIGSGREMAQKHQDFLRYITFEKGDQKTGLSKAEQYERKEGKTYKLPTTNYPETLLSHPDVGMLYDPLEGIHFLEGYGLFVDVFRNFDAYGGWIKMRKVKEIIMGYLESDSISDLPFRKMVGRFPDNFVLVIRHVLKWKEFSVDMVDDLMRYYKPWSFSKLPGHVAILDSEMIRFLQSREE